MDYKFRPTNRKVLYVLISILISNAVYSQTRTINGIAIGGSRYEAQKRALLSYPHEAPSVAEGNYSWDWVARDRQIQSGEKDSYINTIFMAFQDDKVSAVSYQFARVTFSPYAAAYNENNMLDYYESIYNKICRIHGNPSAQDGYNFLWNLKDVVVSLSTEYEYDPAHSVTFYAARVDYLGKEFHPGIGNSNNGDYYASGSGIILNKEGFLVTNYHVIDGANVIDVFININGKTQKYTAREVVSDKQNDLSILKIDVKKGSISPPPFSVSYTVKDVGTSVFALGYPMSDLLGEELKVTDGIISSKSGYQGDITTYQISAPIQPGNSGGPLFAKDGSLIGITNAGVPDAQNVGYAIKATYLRTLIDSAPMPITIPVNNTISSLSFPEKIKRLSTYVILIKIK